MATYTKPEDVQTDVQDDPRARKALEEVFENTARWSAGFNGFTADVTVNINGKEEKGTVTVKGPKEIETTLKDEELKEFATENLASIAMHRGPRSFEQSDGKYKLAFGDDGRHPLGRAVVMGGDGMKSFYRIQDGRIRQINRQTPHVSFSINIEESVKNPEGKFLTKHYTVYYFSPQDKSIKNVESYTDDYVRVDGFDLPQQRRVIDAKNGEVVVSTLTLENHKVL